MFAEDKVFTLFEIVNTANYIMTREIRTFMLWKNLSRPISFTTDKKTRSYFFGKKSNNFDMFYYYQT